MEKQAQKRSISEQRNFLDGIKALLLDIEGTTTSISFVKEILFTYFKNCVQDHIEKNFSSDEIKNDIEALRKQALKDAADGVPDVVKIPAEGSAKEEVIDAVVKNVIWQTDSDRKTTALKQIQGHVWKHGYENGTLKAEHFDDVPATLKLFESHGLKFYVFSSGSVDAQKLIFAHTTEGDLSEMISGYFDTSTGPKTDKESYVTIAESMKMKPETVLFLTDIAAEGTAAKAAGMKCCLVVRKGNAAIDEKDLQSFDVVHTFNELVPESWFEPVPAKKQGTEKDHAEKDAAPVETKQK